MAFLDNSGDIILDAVLTDLGRERMADGNFRISRFALGDDEIDYGLFNKDHPSGSAYYDLEILQTPVFEAFTATNASINHSLLSMTNTEILYMPIIVQNEKTTITTFLKTTGSLVYLAANSETRQQVIGASTTAGPDGHGMQSYNILLSDSQGTSVPCVGLEDGLNTPAGDIPGTMSNRFTYLVANNLIDNAFSVYYDNRFINNILSPGPQAEFQNDSDGNPIVNYALSATTANSTTIGMENYSTAFLRTATNEVTFDASAAIEDTLVSALGGPRGTASMLGFTVVPGLDSVSTQSRDSKYTLYGTTNAEIWGDDTAYDEQIFDYIDTIVYIVGNTTGAQMQIPVRILRYVGATTA